MRFCALLQPQAALLAFLWPVALFAADFHACDQLQGPQDVIDCALDNAPGVKRAKASMAQAEYFRDKAAQRPNPELATSSIFGNALGDYLQQTQLSLIHTWELGGKRNARIEQALAEREGVSAAQVGAKLDVLLSTVSALYRLRQIDAELETVSEATATFDKVLKQYRALPRLTPEQQVSIGTFQLAVSDYQLRKASLVSERTTVIRELSLFLGKPFEPSKKIYPSKITEWPDFSPGVTSIPENSIGLLSPRAQLKTAQAQHELAKSESWPNLLLGPTAQFDTEGPFKKNYFGFSVALALPIFNANGGGRDVARAGVMQAEVVLDTTVQELKVERENLVTRYSAIVDALRALPSLSVLEQKERKLDEYYSRGIIPSTLIIEAQRQRVDYTKSQNDSELLAVQALWRIYAIDGVVFEKRL